MSEYVDPEYRSEFEAPPYTILSREQIGHQVITTVLLDGEISEFVAGEAVHEIGKSLSTPLNQRFSDIVGRIKGNDGEV